MEESCNKKCPFGFENLNIQNIILILLTLKSIWNMVQENTVTPEINIEDILMNQIKDQVLPFGMGKNIIPNCGLGIPNPPNCGLGIPNPPNCGWGISKLILLGIFIYIIFFVRDILDDINVFSIETSISKHSLPKKNIKSESN